MKKMFIILIMITLTILASCSSLNTGKYSGHWVGTIEGSLDDTIYFLTLNDDETYFIEYISNGYSNSGLEVYQEGRYNISSNEIIFEYFTKYSENSYKDTYDIDEEEISMSTYYSDGTLNAKKIYYTKSNTDDIFYGTWMLDEFTIGDVSGNISSISDYEVLTINNDMTFNFNEQEENEFDYRVGINKIYLATTIEFAYTEYLNLSLTINKNNELVLNAENVYLFWGEDIELKYIKDVDS